MTRLFLTLMAAVLSMYATAQTEKSDSIESYLITADYQISGTSNYYFTSSQASEYDYRPIRWTLTNEWFDASGLSVITLSVYDKQTGQRIAYKVWGKQHLFCTRKGDSYRYFVIDGEYIHAVIFDSPTEENSVSLYSRRHN